MRSPAFLVFLVSPLLAQAPATPIHVYISPSTFGMDTQDIQAKAIPAKELLPGILATLKQAGYQVLDQPEGGIPVEGLVLRVSAVDLELRSGARGFDVSVSLVHPELIHGGRKDSQAVGVVSSRMAKGGRITSDTSRASVLSLLEEALRVRAAQQEAPATSPPRPTPQPVALPSQVQGGVVGGTGEVIDFDFREIEIKVQPAPPRYPPLARTLRVQGMVEIELIIDPDGVPQEAKCLQGPRELRTHGVAYALAWRFHPALLNGQPMWAKFRLKMPFTLVPN